MKVIYETKGKANEYNDLALDIYKTCDHNCQYCYLVKNRTSEKILKRKDFITNLKADIEEYKERGLTNYVFLSFSTDPYNIADIELKETRKALEILCENNIPTMILTKGGKRLLRDLDIIEKFKDIKIGMTIVLFDEDKKQLWEPNTASTEERIEVLKILKDKGIYTWVSMEPVIEPDEVFKIIDATKDFTDEYKVGKLNYFKEIEENIDRKRFTGDIVKKITNLGKKFYIKDSLKKYID